MLFNSFRFIFLFLPVVLAAYLVFDRLFVSHLPRLLFLMLASLFFYAFGGVAFLPIILTSISLNYVAGYLLGRQNASERNRFMVFVSSIVFNIALLSYFKYANFFMDIVCGVLGCAYTPLTTELPIGISFFTFTQIAYLTDLYRGYPSERNVVKYALFVSYFPHLIAGPILHHKEMMWQFDCEKQPHAYAGRVAMGLAAFCIGLFKKTIIADSIATFVDPAFNIASSHIPHALDAWIGALAYSLQIYFDFSAYCDMALGLSIMFGIALPFNFNSPYKARSIVEFWRCWHITLSRFLRDYLYIPMGGNRRGKVRRYINLLVAMVIGGLWHGAGVTFVVWGALHGLFLCINHLWRDFGQRFAVLQRFAATRLFGVIAAVLTQCCVVVAWVYFRAENVTQANHVLLGMAAQAPNAELVFRAPAHALGAVALGYLWCLALPNVNDIFSGQGLGLTTYNTPRAWSLYALRWRPTLAWGYSAGLLAVVSLLAILKTGDASPFLYFQF